MTEPLAFRFESQAAFDDFRPQPVEVDAASVIADDDLQRARAVTRFEAHDPFRRLARGTALLRRLDALIDRVADVLERIGLEVDGISHEVFEHPATPRQTGDFQSILRALGRRGDLTSKVRESLVGIGRLLMFFGQASEANAKTAKDLRARLRTMSRDVRSLTEHASFLSAKINFLLDATLGMINIEQNAIIKIFSVVAVVFLPPTLIASIYGMNFDFMPELDWAIGYPLALALMLGSAIAPYIYFKRRGWL